MMTKSREATGSKIRFTDKIKDLKSLTLKIFNAKKARKEILYPVLLKIVERVLKQVDRGLLQVKEKGDHSASMKKWVSPVEHCRLRCT